jgi:hypothetical protein
LIRNRAQRICTGSSYIIDDWREISGASRGRKRFGLSGFRAVSRRASAAPEPTEPFAACLGRRQGSARAV